MDSDIGTWGMNTMINYTSANQSLGEIMRRYAELEDLQRQINQIAKDSKRCSDYEEYKESIESYITLETNL